MWNSVILTYEQTQASHSTLVFQENPSGQACSRIIHTISRFLKTIKTAVPVPKTIKTPVPVPKTEKIACAGTGDFFEFQKLGAMKERFELVFCLETASSQPIWSQEQHAWNPPIPFLNNIWETPKWTFGFYLVSSWRGLRSKTQSPEMRGEKALTKRS